MSLRALGLLRLVSVLLLLCCACRDTELRKEVVASPTGSVSTSSVTATTAATDPPEPTVDPFLITPSAVPVTSATSLAAAAAGSAAPEVPALDRTVFAHVDIDFSDEPLHFTSSFDGSQRFNMWLDTMRFARAFAQRYGTTLHFTYFINTCYYDTTVRGSQIGRAQTREEVLVRRALTQQALNEGHEIGNHGVRHENGMTWSAAQWKSEFDEFHALSDKMLFKPIEDEGRFAFPRFEPPTDVAPRGTGARCETAADCESSSCIEVTAHDSFCTQPCNRKKPCPDGTACGTPLFNDQTDLCVPVPSFPIKHDGEVLFDDRGEPNLDALERYRIIGYRAPFLAFNDGLVETLVDRRYVYDASQVARPGMPLHVHLFDKRGAFLGFPLMQYPGTRTIPMDFNYMRAGLGRKPMGDDYEHSLLKAYEADGRPPWNIGHHFSTWRDGAYWDAMRATLDFAAQGCPGEGGQQRCPDVRFPSFRDLARVVIGKVRKKAP